MCTPGLPARSMRSMRKQHFRLPLWRRKPTADEAAPDIADSELVPSESAAQPTRRKHGKRTYVIGGLELCEDTAELTVDGTPVKLTPLEFKILALLMKNPGRVFSAEEIYERVWNERAVSTDTIMVHIRNIREKIEYNPREPKYLKVVWGIGYKIEK